jgi:hypothetical protein
MAITIGSYPGRWRLRRLGEIHMLRRGAFECRAREWALSGHNLGKRAYAGTGQGDLKKDRGRAFVSRGRVRPESASGQSDTYERP